jgi:hypothetical protein
MVAQCFGENAGLLGNYRIADLTVSCPKGLVRAPSDGDHPLRNHHGVLDVNARANGPRVVVGKQGYRHLKMSAPTAESFFQNRNFPALYVSA